MLPDPGREKVNDMLYSEFLTGTNQTENDWTLEEYNRINALYMDSDTMTKEEAYRLYNEPDQLVKNLLEDKATYKAEMISARARLRTEHEENLSLRIELEKAKKHAANLEDQLNKIKNAAHSLYYSAGII